MSILKRTLGTKIGAGQKRKRGEKRKNRDARLFPYFDTISTEELRNYRDIVFVDFNKRDLLYMMHKDSTKQILRTLRYTSMIRRHHLRIHIQYPPRERDHPPILQLKSHFFRACNLVNIFSNDKI